MKTTLNIALACAALLCAGCANVFDADGLVFDEGQPDPAPIPSPDPLPSVDPPLNPEPGPPLDPEPNVDPPLNPEPEPSPIPNPEPDPEPDPVGMAEACNIFETRGLAACEAICESTPDNVSRADRIDDCFVNHCDEPLTGASLECQLCLLVFQDSGFDAMLESCQEPVSTIGETGCGVAEFREFATCASRCEDPNASLQSALQCLDGLCDQVVEDLALACENCLRTFVADSFDAMFRACEPEEN